MTSRIGGTGKKKHRKVLARPLDLLNILFCLSIMSMPSFQFLPHRFAVFRFYREIMILNEATANSNHHGWRALNFRKRQFMVPRFWSRGLQLPIIARSGATPVHGGAGAKTQVLNLCECHGRGANIHIEGHPFANVLADSASIVRKCLCCSENPSQKIEMPTLLVPKNHYRCNTLLQFCSAFLECKNG